MMPARSRPLRAVTTGEPANSDNWPASNAAPRVAAIWATRRSTPGERRRAVRSSFNRGGSTSPEVAARALRASSWRKSGTPPPRSVMSRHWPGSRSPSGAIAATSVWESSPPRGPSSMSTAFPAQLALSGSRLVMRIITPGARLSTNIPRRSTVVGSAQWRSSTSSRLGVVPREVGQPVDQGGEGLGPQGQGIELRTDPVVVTVDVQAEQGSDQGNDPYRVEAGGGQPALDLGEPILGGLLGVEAEALLEHAPDRPQGHIGVVRRTVRLQDGIALGADPLALIGGQPRLADAGRPPEDDHGLVRRLAFSCRCQQAVPGPSEVVGLLLAVDQRNSTGVGPGSGRRPTWLGRRAWNTSIGREMPLRVRVPTDTRSKWFSTRCLVASLMTTVPGSASAWRRAATLAADPTMSEASTAAGPEASPLTTTVPEWTPTRIATSMPYRSRSSAPVTAIRSTSPRPANTARRASSSCTFG